MSLAFKRLKVYLRLLLVLAVTGALALVLLMNRSHRVEFWFFGVTDADKPVNVVWLMLTTASATLLTWRLFIFAGGLRRDMRELKQLRVIEQARKEQDKRGVDLEVRERRIDEILKRANTHDDKVGNEHAADH